LENLLTKEINLDIILIKLFTNKNYYTKYYSYINNYLVNNYKLNNKLLYKIYHCLGLLHKENDSVSFEDLLARLLREYPALPVDERELATETLQKASESIFNEGEVGSLVQAQYERSKASDVALKAIQVTEGKAGIEDLKKILEDDLLKASEEEEENVYYDNDLAGLYASTKGKHGLRWPLNSLNKSLGSLRPGDFGFFFARPETGKTTFLAHVVTHMVSEAKQPALWINNEEGGNKVLLRCYQSALGLTTDQLFADIEGNQRRFADNLGGLLRLVNDPGLRRAELERLVESTKPCLIVIDQLDKVEGFEAERYDLLQKSKYQWARELAKKYNCAVIAVCQAGGSAENKKKLIMTDVDSSWTAKQGEADWMFGIGKTDESGMEFVRYINICKNKLVGDSDSDPNQRHGYFDVIIEPEVGRYRDRIKWD
jgi:replicative DNA helicase